MLLSCPDTNQACCTALQACREGPEPTYTQPSNTSFNKPTWTVSLLLRDKLSLMEFTKNAVCGPTASHVDHRLDMKPVVQAVCMPSKVSTNETKCPFDSKPQIKQQIHMWVSQLAVRGSRWGVNWSEISATVLVSCQGAEVMSAGHCSLFWRVKSEWGLKVGG